MPGTELRFRQIHLDFHTSEAIEGIGVSFNADRFADTLQAAAVDSITCFARGHHGWIYYDSKINPERIHPHLANRNLLALTSSEDLRRWQVEDTILHHPDPQNHAFQYVDWLFDGPDLIAVSRTAWGNAHNFHDANYFTFHRIADFRKRGQR